MLKKMMFINNSFFVVFLLFATAAAQTQADADLIERFEYRGNSQFIIPAAIIICVLFAIFILIYLLQTKTKKKDIREFSNYMFDEKAKATKLNLAEQILLKNIAVNIAPRLASDIFTSSLIFETAIDIELDKYLNKYGEDSQRTQDLSDMVSRIRTKLGYNKIIAERAIESSRNIESGQLMFIFNQTTENTNELEGARTSVLNSNELYFNADFSELGDFFLKNGKKEGVIAKFTRQNDATYLLHLKIRSINYTENIISFYHTTDLERQQSRKYARISVDTPIKCKIIKRVEDDAAPVAGEILPKTSLNDISGGGLSFLSTTSLSVGDIVMFSFTIGDLKFDMKGKIVAIIKQDGTHNAYYKHRVSFYNPKQSDIERIVKFIYEKQREKINLG